MPARILHVLDVTTPSDALDLLAPLLPRYEHKVVALGHRSTQQLAAGSGIIEPFTFLHTMGWADPTGWRGLRRVIREYQPTHVHAWGMSAALSVTMSRFKGQRLVTLADMPGTRYLQLLQFIHKGGLWVSVSPCHWTVTTTWLKRELHSHSIAADAVTLIRPPMMPTELYAGGGGGSRAELGIGPEDGPVLLLGGDGGVGRMLAAPGMDPVKQGGRSGARHDLGLWATAILRTIFPRIRVIVREDPRQRPNPGLERLMNNLPDDDVIVLAPADWSWQRLLSVADVLVVTPDGPFPAGSIVHAFAARVPVVGTPVDAIREHVTDRHNGLIAATMRPRSIASTLEDFFAAPDLRTRLTEQALCDAATRHDLSGILKNFETLYA